MFAIASRPCTTCLTLRSKFLARAVHILSDIYDTLTFAQYVLGIISPAAGHVMPRRAMGKEDASSSTNGDLPESLHGLRLVTSMHFVCVPYDTELSIFFSNLSLLHRFLPIRNMKLHISMYTRIPNLPLRERKNNLQVISIPS
jgi:hypothetical protein